MTAGRRALASRSLNHDLDAPPSAPSLYPIFLGWAERVTDTQSAGDKSAGTPSEGRSSKRARVDSHGHSHSLAHGHAHHDDKDSHDGRDARTDARSIPDYFTPAVPRRSGAAKAKPPFPQHEPIEVESQPVAPPAAPVWRRQRRRFGFTYNHEPRALVRPFLDTLTHSATLRDTVLLPSLSDHDRHFDPVLSLAFNGTAKRYTEAEADGTGAHRRLAIGGEEGYVKIVNVDATDGDARAVAWWRPHHNALFDMQWAADDRWLLTGSADQTLRIHDMAAADPRLLATLHGHTSTIKATAFLDPSRGSGAAAPWNIIASGGRDGNIHIYDTRCQGIPLADCEPVENGPPRRRSARARPPPPEGPAALQPVLTLRQPHNAAAGRRAERSVTRTITSLVALQCMPGILASGGTYDGVVKLWDIRSPEPTSSLRPKALPYGVLPDPTTYGPSAARRGRSVNALCEQPTTGDLYALCGDSKVHVLRPAAARQGWATPADAIVPRKLLHPELLVKSFYVRMALSPDGRHLAAGSHNGGVMTWDLDAAPRRTPCADLCRENDVHVATRLMLTQSAGGAAAGMPDTWAGEMPEVNAVDWGKDMLAASSTDSVNRIWRAKDV